MAPPKKRERERERERKVALKKYLVTNTHAINYYEA